MNNSPVNKHWFEAQISNRKLSQRRLAALLGLDPSAMSLMLAGKRKMSVTEAGEVSKHLGVPVEDVLRHAGVAVPTNTEKSVPIVGTIGERLEVKLGRPQGARQTVAAPARYAAKGRVLLVQQQGFMYGWKLLYIPVEGVSIDAIGRLCIVRKAGDDRLYVRQVNRGQESGWVSLFDPIGISLEDARLESASPVLAIDPS